MIKQILTGPDNTTLAVGRVLGAGLFILLLVIFPGAELITVVNGTVSPETWETIYNGLAVYVPAIVLAIGGLIAGTNFTEPGHRASPPPPVD